MNLLQTIIAHIREHGEASPDRIRIPGVVRQQITKAFQNAVSRRQIKAIKHRRDRFGHAAPSVYALWDDPRPAVGRYVGKPVLRVKRPPKVEMPSVAPVSSVFEMGERIAHGQPCWVQRKPRQDFDNPSAG